MGRKNVSLKMIAGELGVSVNTVSHALRDFGDISSETKRRVRQKAIELGYMPNLVSQHSKDGEKPAVAILVNSFINYYFMSLVEELTRLFAEKQEYNFLFLYYRSYEVSIEIIKQCILQRVDLLVTHASLNAEVMEYARMNNVQIIIVGAPKGDREADYVTVDDEMGCVQAARYLFGFHSSKKYLYVGINNPLSDFRFNVFKKELNSLGVDDVISLSYEAKDLMRLYDYIAQGYRSVFVYNDETAYSAIADLDKLVVDIRKMFPDLHIVGFDGLCEVIPGMKQITTIKIDYAILAKSIYNMIGFRLENPKEPYRKIVLPVSLHQRKKKD